MNALAIAEHLDAEINFDAHDDSIHKCIFPLICALIHD